MVKRLLLFLLVLTLTITPATLYASDDVKPLPTTEVAVVSAAPYVAEAGAEIRISVSLTVQPRPSSVAVTYTETGSDPQRLEVPLSYNPSSDRYEGKVSTPEVIDHSTGYQPVDISYQTIDPLGLRTEHIAVTSADGAFFITRNEIRLKSWDIPTTGKVGTEANLKFAFEKPVGFRSDMHIVFESMDLVQTNTFQTDSLSSDDGISLNGKVTLPSIPGLYEARYLRVGDHLIPLYHAHKASIQMTGIDVPEPTLTNVLVDPFDPEQISLEFTNNESIVDARIQLTGPFHSQAWVTLRPGTPSAQVGTVSQLGLPYTGHYYFGKLLVDLKSGATRDLSPNLLEKFGVPGFFHSDPSKTWIPTAEQKSASITNVGITDQGQGHYHLVIQGLDLPQEPLFLSFTGGTSTFGARCDFDSSQNEWIGGLEIPVWARGGLYRLTRVQTGEGAPVTVNSDVSFIHTATSPDSAPPEIESISTNVQDGMGTVNVILNHDESGSKVVVLSYVNRVTQARIELKAEEATSDQWVATRIFDKSELGVWALATVRLEDNAGNVSRLGWGSYDPEFYPEGQLWVVTGALDQVAPEVTSLNSNKVDEKVRLDIGIHDAGTGVDPQSIKVTLDGVQSPAVWDQSKQEILLVPLVMSIGVHDLMVDVSDLVGNSLPTALQFSIPPEGGVSAVVRVNKDGTTYLQND